MTLTAIQSGVFSGQRISGCIMIEPPGCPCRSIVACGAIGRKPGGGMVWIAGCVVIVPVASGAFPRRAGVLTVGMAGRAVQTGMGTAEIKTRMGECSGLPGACIMTRGTVCSVSRGGMVWIGGGGVVVGVARSAFLRRSGVCAAGVAFRTRYGLMGAGQTVPGGVMIKCTRCPSVDIMALDTIRRKPGGAMVRIPCAVVIRFMARQALRG